MPTRQELIMKQSLPLSVKTEMTQQRIKEWVDFYGEDGVYISFSGGKDSTVLLHLAREIFPNMRAVFVDTGLEYPQIREFIKTIPNVEWIKPEINFKEVIKKYGYPFVSKEVSETAYYAKKYLNDILKCETEPHYEFAFNRIIGISEYNKEILGQRDDIEKLANFLNERKNAGGENRRLAIMLGLLNKDSTIKVSKDIKDRSMYSFERWAFLLNAPFDVSHMCCKIMKKNPINRYERKNGLHPITAQMAAESRQRTQAWIRNGCNAFNAKKPISNPMSFWLEQDVLQYIVRYNIPICSVYGEIVSKEDETYIDFLIQNDNGVFDKDKPKLKTTGCSRTGCMFCGFGCHLEKPGSGRFERMKQTHPSIYKWIMKPVNEGGLGYKDVIDWLNEHGNLDIRY